VAKLTRKELLSKEDAFTSAAQQSVEWVADHKRQVIVLTSAGFIAIAAIWTGLAWKESRDVAASELLAAAITTYDAQVITESETTKANPTGEEPTFATEEAKRTAALEKFRAVIDAASSSAVADVARFYVGKLEADAGNAAAAEKTFTALVDSLSTKDSLYFLALERLAYLQEGRGDVDGAIAALGRVAQNDEAPFRDVAMYHQARLYLAKGDTERGKNLLAAIEKDFPKSPVKDDVKNRLALLGGTAAAAPTKEAP
jgi:predicted negative regulator of RcsB-dependent stress response